MALVRSVFDTGCIPASQRAATLVPIPKKGDLSDLGNYRGISLISLSLKLISAIVAKRLSDSIEERGDVVRELKASTKTAGFRYGPA